MRFIYIAHPIGGDVKGNLEKIRLIVRQINLEEPEVVPVAPYWLDCHALDDKNPEERARGIKNDKEYFYRKVIDEVRLYGDYISEGMRAEINLALDYRIPVIPCSEATKKMMIDELKGKLGIK